MGPFRKRRNRLIKHLPFDEPNRLPSPPGFYYESSQEEKEVNLRDYWRVIQKRRWTIIVFFLIVLITTAVATFTMKPIYRGTTTVQINKENPQIVDFKEIFAVNTMDMDYYQTQYKLLESRTLAKRVVQTLKIGEHPEFLSKPETPFQKWKSSFFGSILGFFTPSNQNASAEKGSAKNNFDSNFPELSTQVPNTLAMNYIQQSLENRVQISRQQIKKVA